MSVQFGPGSENLSPRMTRSFGGGMSASSRFNAATKQ